MSRSALQQYPRETAPVEDAGEQEDAADEGIERGDPAVGAAGLLVRGLVSCDHAVERANLLLAPIAAGDAGVDLDGAGRAEAATATLADGHGLDVVMGEAAHWRGAPGTDLAPVVAAVYRSGPQSTQTGALWGSPDRDATPRPRPPLSAPSPPLTRRRLDEDRAAAAARRRAPSAARCRATSIR